jgi:hypothetical protein
MKKKSWVKAGDEWIDLNKKSVQFQDVAEGFDGRDIITFEYKGKQYESFVIISHTKPN